MKTTTAWKVLAICLVFIFIIGPTTALTGFSGKAAIIDGYKSSSGYSLDIYAGVVKPNPQMYIEPTFKPSALTPYPKPDWAFCSECAFKNSTRSFSDVFLENYTSPKASFYFGGGVGGASAGGGGGCCG
jgi:hypothetical protein